MRARVTKASQERGQKNEKKKMSEKKLRNYIGLEVGKILIRISWSIGRRGNS